MVIVDTSMWIEYFNRKGSRYAAVVRTLIGSDLAVLAGPILFELVQGAKLEQERELLINVLDVLPYIEIDKSLWIEGGMLSFQLRKKGITIPMTDCMIAALAKRNGYQITTLDSHFDHFPDLLYPSD